MGNNEEEVRAELKEFIQNNFLVATGSEGIDDDTSFFQKGIIDSTGVLELIDFLEDNYSLVIENEEIIPDNLDSYNKIVQFILRKRS